MIYASDFRKGMTFDINGEPHVVLDFQHVKPGKGAAFVRTKYRNILTGATREEAFNPSDKFEQAHIETKKMQYLYNDGELYDFMDPENYDQVPLSYDLVEDAIKYIKENDEVTVKFYQGSAFTVEAPNFVDLEVIDILVVIQRLHDLLGTIDLGEQISGNQPLDGVLIFCRACSLLYDLVLEPDILLRELN